MKRSPSPRTIVIAIYKANKLRLALLIQELRTWCLDLEDDLDRAQDAVKQLVSEGMLQIQEQGFGPHHTVVLKRSLPPTPTGAPLAA